MIVWVLKSCDTCRKALNWLDGKGIDHTSRDVRQDGLDEPDIEAIIAAVGVDQAINRRSTTWRGLDESDRADLTAERAAALLAEHPTLLKRPVFVRNGEVLVGFDDKVRAALTA